MKIIFKNKKEFLNILYGDNDDYDYITKEQVNEIIDCHIDSLDKIYDYLDETDKFGVEQYDLGDCTNLVELFKNIEFEETDEDIEDEECK